MLQADARVGNKGYFIWTILKPDTVAMFANALDKAVQGNLAKTEKNIRKNNILSIQLKNGFKTSSLEINYSKIFVLTNKKIKDKLPFIGNFEKILRNQNISKHYFMVSK